MNLSNTYLVAILAVDFVGQFPEEEFLNEELDRVLGGLTNSLRWAVYREATKGDTHHESLESRITTLNTLDHFSTSYMERQEIITRIRHTSGLTEEQSAFGLSTLEATIDKAIEDHAEVVVDLFGRITRSEIHPHGYQIALVEHMQLGPKAMYA